MKMNKLVSLALLATVLIGVSTAVMPSSFTECYLEADVLEVKLKSDLDGIDTLHVQVSTLDNTNSIGCQYKIGQQILIHDIEHENISASDITTGVSLQLNFLTYQAMGSEGPISGSTWTVIEVIK